MELLRSASQMSMTRPSAAATCLTGVPPRTTHPMGGAHRLQPVAASPMMTTSLAFVRRRTFAAMAAAAMDS